MAGKRKEGRDGERKGGAGWEEERHKERERKRGGRGREEGQNTEKQKG